MLQGSVISVILLIIKYSLPSVNEKTTQTRHQEFEQFIYYTVSEIECNNLINSVPGLENQNWDPFSVPVQHH